MSSDKGWVLSGVERGSGLALDLGGGKGELAKPLTRLGYAYVNLDSACSAGAERCVKGDAHRIPFSNGSFTLVVSSDSLEHFVAPRIALSEAHRVLKEAGKLVIWVPFMHPFHGDDLFRYTPLGLKLLLSEAGFTLERLEAPIWVFSVVGQAIVALLQRTRLGFLERFVERSAAWLDNRFARFQGQDLSFAAAYLVVANKVDLG